MGLYHVIVTIWAPYPIEQTFNEQATHVSAAVSRALKKAYDAVEHKRRIQNYSIKINKA